MPVFRKPSTAVLIVAARTYPIPNNSATQLDLGGTVANILPPGVICHQWLHEADIEWLHEMATMLWYNADDRHKIGSRHFDERQVL